MEVDEARLAEALFCIPADDREEWYLCAFGVKNALGEGGFALWDRWSRTSDAYVERDARATWRSAKEFGGTTVATVFKLARDHGWRPAERARPAPPTAEELARRRERQDRERLAQRNRLRRADEARVEAQRLIDESERERHPYLDRKGFIGMYGLVHNGKLVIPMRSHDTNELRTAQLIDADGAKLYLPGGRAGLSVLRLGGSRRPRNVCYVEGYATGLSVRAALDELRLSRDQVVVTFSDGNLKAVASVSRPGYVVADHDMYICPKPPRGCSNRWLAPWGAQQCPACKGDSFLAPAGERAARDTGLPFWQPAGYGDANDVHQVHGLEELVREVRALRQRWVATTHRKA